MCLVWMSIVYIFMSRDVFLIGLWRTSWVIIIIIIFITTTITAIALRMISLALLPQWSQRHMQSAPYVAE